jgi:hypothetical protein
MVEAARWWKARRHGEDLKLGQQQAHQVSSRHGMRGQRGGAPDRALPSLMWSCAKSHRIGPSVRCQWTPRTMS